jgi:hypothetical protein
MSPVRLALVHHQSDRIPGRDRTKLSRTAVLPVRDATKVSGCPGFFYWSPEYCTLSSV